MTKTCYMVGNKASRAKPAMARQNVYDNKAKHFRPAGKDKKCEIGNNKAKRVRSARARQNV